MDIIEEVKEITTKLNALDEYNKNLYHERDVYDEKTIDILHYIENNNLTTAERYRIVKELKNIRTERRKVKNDIELSRVYNDNKNKLSSENNRQFLLQELYNRKKTLGIKYKNRQYTEEELEEIIK